MHFLHRVIVEMEYFLILLEKIQMLYSRPLREAGRKDFHPKEEIEDSIKGVDFDYLYTGRRTGTSGQIELHVTSIVKDWDQNTYIRKAWYMGNKKGWKDCIRLLTI